MKLDLSQHSHFSFETESQVAPGSELTLILHDNPSTGYLWEIEAIPDGLVRLGEQTGDFVPDVDFETQKKDALVGVGGKLTLHFRANGKAKGTLRIVHRRPWLKDTNEDDPAIITINLI